jgi:hypothetical protein
MVVFGLARNGSDADDDGMGYVVTRNRRFCVVAYDGHRPTHRSRTTPLAPCRLVLTLSLFPALKWSA